MRLYDETCVALCEGQYLDIWTSRARRGHVGRALLRHDRAQDRGADRRLDRGRRAARDRRRRGHRRATAAFGWALGLAFQLNDDLLGIWGAERSTGKEPSDVAHRKKTLPVIYAFEHATARGPARGSPSSTRPGRPDARGTSPRSWRSSSGPAPASYTRDEARRYRDAGARRARRRGRVVAARLRANASSGSIVARPISA